MNDEDLSPNEMRRRLEEAEAALKRFRFLAEAGDLTGDIVDTVREPLVVLDADLRVVTANRSFYRVFKVRPEETEGRVIYELGNGQWDIPELRRLLEDVLDKNASFDDFPVEHEFEHIGRRMMLLNARRVVRNAEKTPLILLAIEDITEAKRASEDASRLAAIVESSNDAIIGKDLDGTILSWNKAAERMYGYSAEEAVGKPISIIVPEGREEESSAILARVAKGEHVEHFETLRKKKDGTLLDVSLTMSPIRDSEGGIVGASTVERDVTERKRRQDKIARLRDVLRAIGDLLQVIIRERDKEAMIKGVCEAFSSCYPANAIVVLDENGNVAASAESGLGGDFAPLLELFAAGNPPECMRSALLERDGLFVMDHKSHHRDCPMPPVYRERNGFVLRLEHERKNFGLLMVFLPPNIPVSDEEKALAREAAYDVAFGLYTLDMEQQQKSLDEQLRQSQKMEAIGQLAGGVAHDFNNMLSVILGYSDMLLKSLDEDDPAHQQVREIKECAKRSAQLTRQLLAFSRKQVLAPKIIDLNDVVVGIQSMLARLIGENIQLTMELADGLWPVKADPAQMEQVLMNLAVNARDAMPQGGKLTIETANVVLDDEYGTWHAPVEPGEYVLLAVTDTGCGMDEKTVSRAFEPFYTTKETGKGTGMGLPTVYGIVKQSGGYIWIYSEPGKGTTLKIYLPRERAKVAPTGAERVEKSVREGSGQLLVVEDEDSLRKLLVRTLTAFGYDVTAVGNADEASILMEEKKLRPRLLLTDVVLPGVSGVTLAERLRRLHPDLKVLYMSGYTDNAIVHQGILDPGTPFIQKPFSIDDLGAKIRELLDRD